MPATLSAPYSATEQSGTPTPPSAPKMTSARPTRKLCGCLGALDVLDLGGRGILAATMRFDSESAVVTLWSSTASVV